MPVQIAELAQPSPGEITQAFNSVDSFLAEVETAPGREKLLGIILTAGEISEASGWKAEWNGIGLDTLKAKDRFRTTFKRTNGRYSALATAHGGYDPDRDLTFVLVFRELANRAQLVITDEHNKPTELGHKVNFHSLAAWTNEHLDELAKKLNIPVPPPIDYYLPDPAQAIQTLLHNQQLRLDIKTRLTAAHRFQLDPGRVGLKAEMAGIDMPEGIASAAREHYLTEIQGRPGRRLDFLAEAYFPEDSDRQAIFIEVLKRTLAAAGCPISSPDRHQDMWNQANLHPLAGYVAQNLDVLVEQVSLSPAEVLRFKLLTAEAVSDRRAKYIDYQRQIIYKFSPDDVLEFLKGEAEGQGVWITVQLGLGNEARQAERWFTVKDKDISPAQRIKSLTAGASSKDTIAVLEQLVRERSLFREATLDLTKRVKDSKDLALPYLVMSPPAHILGDVRHSREVVEELGTFADLQVCWQQGTALDEVTRGRLRQYAGQKISAVTVELMPEAYHEAEAWLVRQMSGAQSGGGRTGRQNRSRAERTIATVFGADEGLKCQSD